MRAVLLFVAVLLMPSFSHGQALPVRNDGVTSTLTGNRTSVRAPAANGYWIPQPNGSTMRIHTTGPIVAPGGKSANAKVYLDVVPGGAGGYRRFLAKALKALPLIGTGLVLWEAWQEFGVRPDGAGGLERDVGVDPEEVTVPCWRVGTWGGCFSTPGPAVFAYADANFFGVTKVECIGACDAESSQTWRFWYFGGGSVQARDVQNTPTVQQVCPGGGSVRGDGKCPSGLYQPTTEEAVEPLLEARTAAQLAPAMEHALDLAPFPIPDSKPLVDPASIPDVQGDPVTTTTPDGTTTEQKRWEASSPDAGEVEWTAVTTKTNPDGTTETTTGEKEQIVPCGLPDSPKCLIDELDTPKQEALSAPKAEIEAAHKARSDSIPDVTKSEGKNTGWTFSLALPTGCTALSVDMRYKGFGQLVNVDPCQAQSVMHDLMSLLWAAGTLFVVVGMFGRTLREA